MYFTSISALRGNVQATVSTGNLPIPFGGAHDLIFSNGPNASYTANPSFDVAVQDTRQFWLGISTAVPVTTLKYFLEQGWPSELVLHVFVRTIEFNDLKFTNYPGNASAMEAFTTVLRSFFNCRNGGAAWKCDVHFEEDEPEPIGRPLEHYEIGSLNGLAEIDKDGLKLVYDECAEGKYRLVAKKSSIHIASVFNIGEASKALKSARQELCKLKTVLDAVKGRDIVDPETKRDIDALIEDTDSNLKSTFKELSRIRKSLEEEGASKKLKKEAKNAISKITKEDTKVDFNEWVKSVQLARAGALDSLKRLDHCCKTIGERPSDVRGLRDVYARLREDEGNLSAMQKQVSRYCVGTTTESSCNAKAYLRSPESMLYYLGEIVRRRVNPETQEAQAAPDVTVQYCNKPDPPQPLFRVQSGADVATAPIISITYEGTKYFIESEFRTPTCSRSLTTETLTLVSLLFAQQTEGSQVPATGAVNIVGPLPPH
jgi:hypothetical protein